MEGDGQFSLSPNSFTVGGEGWGEGAAHEYLDVTAMRVASRVANPSST